MGALASLEGRRHVDALRAHPRVRPHCPSGESARRKRPNDHFAAIRRCAYTCGCAQHRSAPERRKRERALRIVTFDARGPNASATCGLRYADCRLLNCRLSAWTYPEGCKLTGRDSSRVFSVRMLEVAAATSCDC